MKKRIIAILLTLVLMFNFGSGVISVRAEKKETQQTACLVTVSYRTHIQDIGWEDIWKINGQMSGTSGEGKRLEGICIQVSGDSKLGIQYTTHVQDYGWLPWTSDGDMSGTEGEAKRLEAIKIQLTGENKEKYDIYYRVHAQDYGWLNWTKNGGTAGTAGLGKRLESIQIVVVNKGESITEDMGGKKSASEKAYVTADKNIDEPVVEGDTSPSVLYSTHIQDYGWQGWKYNGVLSGTYGQGKRLEGIKIKLTNMDYSGGITYSTHIQDYGWQEWKSDGAFSGTEGQGKRLEAIKIKLTGDISNYYDVYYRVHTQNLGWLSWAKNGESAGTAGLGYRLESIEIVVISKADSFDADSYLYMNCKTPGTTIEKYLSSDDKMPFLDAGGGNAELVKTALGYLGIPYVYGGNSKAGTDCSGLLYMIFKDCGYNIPRTAAGQQDCGTAVASGDVRPGDIVPGSHTAIYIGSGFAVQSPVWMRSESGIEYVGTDTTGRRVW